MYADDTTLTSSAEDPCVLEHKFNCDMNLIQSWLPANKLTLNVKKTKFMLIGSQFKLSQTNSDFTVKVSYSPLERVIKHKSLGVQIDESLNWRPHIHTISKKISSGIAILKRVSHFIPFDTRVNMYNALVMPYFTVVLYGVISIIKTNFKRCRIGLLELSPFLVMRFAKVFCWMSLSEKG